MDKGYDNARVYAECEERGVEPVIPLRGAKANQVALPLALGGRLFPRIPRHTPEFRDLYAVLVCRSLQERRELRARIEEFVTQAVWEELLLNDHTPAVRTWAELAVREARRGEPT